VRSFCSNARRMARDLGVRRALRRLDHLPAGVAVAVSVGLGGAIGFFCLRSVGEVSLPRALLFLALVALAAPLAISARPVAVPVEVEPAKDTPIPRAWRRRLVLVGALVATAAVIMVTGFVIDAVDLWSSRHAPQSGPSTALIAAPPPSASSAAIAPPAVSSAPAQASPQPSASAGSPGIDKDYGRFDAVPVRSGVAVATVTKPSLLPARPPASTSAVPVGPSTPFVKDSPRPKDQKK
jgi:hypothetical protein